LRVSLPSAQIDAFHSPLPGELSRRQTADSTRILLHADNVPPALLTQPGLRIDRLTLEDLFIEVAG
jgi:ABC-2 type transport system ATP-binding protein